VLLRPLGAIDDEEVDRPILRVELEPELFPQR
jgi:hypothetical protein